MDAIIGRLADSLAEAETLEDLTRPLLEMLEAVTGLESTYLTRIDLDAGIQQILYARNTRTMVIPEGLSVPWEDTLCKRALDEGRMFTDDVGTCWGDSDAARALGIQTYLSTPVRMADGALYGTLCAASAERGELSAQAGKVLDMFARLIGRHLEREQLLMQLQDANAQLLHTARTDPVTGLPNRRALLEELQRMLTRCRRDGSSLAVAFLDLDGFKQVNDRYGHEAGDQLLALVAAAIQSSRRSGDFVARAGGDEFIVLAPVSAASAPIAVDALKASLSAATRGQYRLSGHTVDYDGASIGIVLAPEGATDGTALIAQADEAMYRDKHERKRRAPR